MIRVGILGEIGSGKTYVAKCFGYPVFNADSEVSKLYSNDIDTFKKLKICEFYVNRPQTNTPLFSKQQ